MAAGRAATAEVGAGVDTTTSSDRGRPTSAQLRLTRYRIGTRSRSKPAKLSSYQPSSVYLFVYTTVALAAAAAFT